MVDGNDIAIISTASTAYLETYNNGSANIRGEYFFIFEADSFGTYTFTSLLNNMNPRVFAVESGNITSMRFLPYLYHLPTAEVSHQLNPEQQVIVVLSRTIGGAVPAGTGVRLRIERGGEQVQYLRPVRRTVQPPVTGQGFRAPRSGGRLHAGIDFTPTIPVRATYINEGIPLPGIYAVSGGYAFMYFLNFYRDTNALFVRKDDGRIVLYGEIYGISEITDIVSVTNRDRTVTSGQEVRVHQGQMIGRMAVLGGSNPTNLFLLHLEYFMGTGTGNLMQNNSQTYDYIEPGNFGRRRDLLDPTHFFWLPYW